MKIPVFINNCKDVMAERRLTKALKSALNERLLDDLNSLERYDIRTAVCS